MVFYSFLSLLRGEITTQRTAVLVTAHSLISLPQNTRAGGGVGSDFPLSSPPGTSCPPPQGCLSPARSLTWCQASRGVKALLPGQQGWRQPSRGPPRLFLHAAPPQSTGPSQMHPPAITCQSPQFRDESGSRRAGYRMESLEQGRLRRAYGLQSPGVIAEKTRKEHISRGAG